MRLLVTGGAGFIGSHTVDALVQRGHDVAILDDLSSGKREQVNPSARLCPADLRDAGRVTEIIESNPCPPVGPNGVMEYAFCLKTALLPMSVRLGTPTNRGSTR